METGCGMDDDPLLDLEGRGGITGIDMVLKWDRSNRVRSRREYKKWHEPRNGECCTGYTDRRRGMNDGRGSSSVSLLIS